MTELISSLTVPLIMTAAALIMLLPRFSGGDGVGVFVNGAREGLRTAASMLPTLVLLNVAVSLFSASGLAGFLSSVLALPADRIGHTYPVALAVMLLCVFLSCLLVRILIG